MTVYTVHAPRRDGSAPVDPVRLVFVKDGFCWPALFIPLIWLIWRGLWLPLVLYVVLGVGLAVGSSLMGADISTGVMLLFAFWFALEANGLRRWWLEVRGYSLVGVVEGRTLDEAERRWFEIWDEGGASVAAAKPVHVAAAPAAEQTAPRPMPKRDHGIVGLFPTPGARP